ncbi:MAG TPA: hypothetical protein VN688_04525 [Gemmataceae bacterium]|nr:hypothetical protein [Gemmataceae bacterium]
MSKQAKRQRQHEQRQANRDAAMLHVEDVTRAALERGLRLRISFITGPQSQSPHWQFRDGQTEERLLDWWPATQRWWSARTGERGRAADPWAVLEVARKLAGCVGVG